MYTPPSSYRPPRTHWLATPDRGELPVCGTLHWTYATPRYAYQVDCGRCLRILDAQRGREQDELADQTTRAR